jgi:hypothetical protein
VTGRPTVYKDVNCLKLDSRWDHWIFQFT